MENKNVKQTGLLYEYNPNDFRVGASPLVPEIVNQTGDWRDWRPTDERQYKDYAFDTMSCATFSALNVLETTVNFLISNNKIPADKVKWLNNNGYIVDGKLNLSDRFTAIMSGTTAQGNYMPKVWDSIRKDGVIPEIDLPFGGNTQAEYLDANLITKAMKEKAVKFLNIVECTYEWTSVAPGDLEKALKECTPHIAINYSTHAVQLIEKTSIYDTYPPFLGPISTPITLALKVFVRVKTIIPRTLKFGMYGDDVKTLQEDLKSLGFFINPETTRYFGKVTLESVRALQKINGLLTDGVVGPDTRKMIDELKKKSETSKIELWAKAIQTHEGYFEGSRSFRNNNPANFKIGTKLSSYMKSLGATGIDSGGFVIFPDYNTGFKALCTFLEQACNNKLRAYRGNMTLAQFFAVYAPSSDNNDPLEYARVVANALWVTVDTQIASLLKVGSLSDNYKKPMSKLFTISKEELKSAVISGLFLALLAILVYVKDAGSIWSINWKDLANVGVMALVVSFISILKNFLTTSTGKFVGVVKIK